MEILDLQGNLEEDVTLDQPAVILLRLDAGKLGGVADALAIHEAGGIRVYRRAGPQEEWAEVDFTLVSDDEGGITVFVTGVLQFGCFVAVADTSVLPPAAPAADPTPEPPRPSRSLSRWWPTGRRQPRRQHPPGPRPTRFILRFRGRC